MHRSATRYATDIKERSRTSRSQNGVDRAIIHLMRAMLLVSFLFMIFPMIDLAVARFFARGTEFTLSGHPVLMGLRQIGLKAPLIAMAAMALMIVLALLRSGKLSREKISRPLFVLLSLVTGQLVVETLKPLIGRARPRQLIEFGGDAVFTPVWQFAAECSRNCSFPSGEATGAASMLALLVFVPKKYLAFVAAGYAPLLMLIAFNRVMFGAHFLSDVMLGWLITMLAMAWIWRLLARRHRGPVYAG